MSDKPSEHLERQIERIHRLLEGVDAHVTWNDHIPDPDNPNRLRQVDVTIRRDDSLTIVECRAHKNAQDVNWIEELAGRRMSLAADVVIGVSSSGFTEGARLKAQRFGVVLRDFETLSAEEVSRWGVLSTLTLVFYEFRDVELTFTLPARPNIDSPQITDPNGQPINWRDILMKMTEKYDLNTMQDHFKRFHLGLHGARLFIGRVPAQSIEIKGRMRSRRRQAEAPILEIYGKAGEAKSSPEAHVESFDLGKSQVIHGHELCSIVFDLSQVKMPDRSVFGYPLVSNSKGLRLHSAELIGTDNIFQSKVPLKFVFQWH